jgi:oligoribonuclease NrnB/cAMP/cGMP phosphodiesterase (DHH superfamily)
MVIDSGANYASGENEMSLQKPMLCIYHGNCADGFGAAWVVRKAMGDAVEFYPGVYQKEPPDVTGRDVLIVDFSYKRLVLLEMAKKAEFITILDHHKTAIDDLVDLPSNVKVVFALDRSGAMITWDYFFPDNAPPSLLEHIQDRDLWLFKLDGTREVQASVSSYPYDFHIWDKLMTSPVQELRNEGVAIERKHHKDIIELVAIMKYRMDIGGYDVPVASLPHTFSSDAGHLMAENEPFAACYYDSKDGRNFSLRSREDGVDVSAVAKHYGGGGHRNAAGFRVPPGHELTFYPATSPTTVSDP